MPAFSVNVILFSHSQDGCPIVPPSRIHVTRSSPGLEKVAPCLHVSLSLSLSLNQEGIPSQKCPEGITSDRRGVGHMLTLLLQGKEYESKWGETDEEKKRPL